VRRPLLSGDVNGDAEGCGDGFVVAGAVSNRISTMRVANGTAAANRVQASSVPAACRLVPRGHVGEFDPLPPGTMILAIPAAGGLDEEAAYGHGAAAKKLLAAIELLAADEPGIGFVDERGCARRGLGLDTSRAAHETLPAAWAGYNTVVARSARCRDMAWLGVSLSEEEQAVVNAERDGHPKGMSGASAGAEAVALRHHP